MTETETSDDLFEGVDVKLESPSDSKAVAKDVIKMDMPSMTSPEWNDAVMGLFEENELFDGRPVCAGLRRVAEMLLGRIVSSRPTQVFPPQNGSEVGRSTVVWEVIFRDGSLFSDVADCWEGNTDDMFCVFSTATAATRAEGRALRKALRIKTVAAEEMTTKNTAGIVKEMSRSSKKSKDSEYDATERMTDSQANFIDVKAKQLDVDVEKFFKTVFDLNVNRKIDKLQASAAIQRLNDYQQDSSLISSSILSYQSDWRNTSK